MTETTKKDNKRDKKETHEESNKPPEKPEKIVQAKHVDFFRGAVLADNIRKEINTCEKRLSKNWSERYNYLTGDYLKKVLAEECVNAGIPVDTFERKPPENSSKQSPIPLKSSPMPIPTTSSAIVGWRSSRREYDLEFVGPLYVSAKHTIEPPLLPGEFRVSQQKFVFLA